MTGFRTVIFLFSFFHFLLFLPLKNLPMHYFPVKNAEETACQQLLLHLQVLVFYSSPTRCIWYALNSPISTGIGIPASISAAPL